MKTEKWIVFPESRLYVNLNPWESDYVKLLGINIDRSLKFDFHMLKKCSKANKKLTILSRMFKFLTFKKRRVLIKAFSESQFKYCPLVWMFLGRQINNKINYLHEQTLRMIYEDSTSSFDTLLEKDVIFCPRQKYSTTWKRKDSTFLKAQWGLSSILKVLNTLWNFDQSRLYLPVELKSLIVILCVIFCRI